MAARTTSRLRALLALAVLTAAASARADWVQVTPPAGVSAAANLRVVVVAGAETWVVGDDGLSPVVLRGFETPTLVPQSEHHATGTLKVACGFGDGSLHAFGRSVHASYRVETGLWTNESPPAAATPTSATCVTSGAERYVYTAGSTSVLEPYVSKWLVGSATIPAPVQPLFSSAVDAAGFRAVDDGVLGALNELFAYPENFTPLAGGPSFTGKFRAIRFSSTSGLAVARDTATPKAIVLQIGSGNALTAGGDPGFGLINDATLLDTGFAVVVGDAGAISVSHDGGASWTSRTIPSGPNLLSVACRDEVHCYVSGATAALYYWRNEAPTAQITAVVEGTSRDPVGGVLTAVGNENVCLTAIGTDLEEQPLTWLWSEPSLTLKGGSGTSLDGSTAVSPECFDVPQCGGTFEIGATANDGELTASAIVSLQASAAAIAPTLQLGFTNGFVNGGVLSGTDSAEASIAPSHPCASSFDYAWDCLDSRGVLFDPGNVPVAAFANPGDLCSDESITCNVSVTPTLAGQPNATVGVSVNYAAAASRPTTVATSFTNVSAQGVIALGQTGSVTLTPENRCAGSYSTTWSCTDGVNPGASALTRDFVHPTTTTCGGQSVDCSVTIAPDIGDPTTTSFSVSYEPSPRPVVVDSAFTGALSLADQRLAVGESGRVTLTPSQSGCTTTFAATWSCSDGVNPAADVFFRDFTNARASGCADETITCSVEVRSALTGETGSTSFSVVLAPNPGAVVAPATFSAEFTGDRLAVGQSGRVALTPSQGSCTTSYQTVWSCSDGLNPGAGALFRDFTNARTSGCADEPISCSVEVISALDGTSTATSFTVNLAPNPGPVAVASAFSGALTSTDHRLAVGESGRVALTPSQGSCTTTFAATWSCSDGVNPAADVFFRDFANARASGCADETITCSVTVRSALTGETGSTSFSVVLAPNPGPVVAPVVFSAEFTGDRLAVGQSGRVTIEPSQGTCPTSYLTSWSCSDGLNPASGALFRDFTNARAGGCADEPIDCSVEVISALDGSSTTTSFTVNLAPNPGPVAVLSELSSEFVGGRLAAGRSGAVTLVPSQGTCTTSFSATWNCSDGVAPAAGELARGFDNTATSGCDDRTIDCSVEVRSALTGETGTASFSVVLAPNPGALTATAAYSPEFGVGNRLDPGQSGSVSMRSTHQIECPATFTETWSCSDGVTATGSPPVRAFTNSRTSGCLDEPIDCTVEVVSSLTGASATTSFSVVLAPNPGPTTVNLALDGFGAGNTLGYGQSGSVTAAATGVCPGGFDYLWRCDGLPDASGAVRSFTHAQQLCSDASIRCTVDASPLGASRAGSAVVDLLLLVAPFPADLELQLSGTTTLDAGDTLTADVAATHCDGATFAYAWECSGPGASGQGATATFVHPGLLCEAAHASCQVSVTATSEQGVAQPVASLPAPIEADYLPAFEPPSNLRVVAITVTGDEIAAEAQIDAECPFAPDYSWVAKLRSSGELVGEGTGATFGSTLPPLCGSDWVDLELREATTGLSATAELAVEGWRGALTLEDPLEQGYESRPQLDCAAAPVPIVFVPRATGCVRGFDWRQTAGPALSLEPRADGALVVEPLGAAFGGLVGRQARFEVEAYNDDGRSATRAFELTFEPKPFVKVRHVADRPVAAAGELADFTVQLQVGCEAPPEAVDVHLALEDLDYVGGSARLDGQALAEPEWSAGELVFRAVPLSAGSTPTIAYSARRKAVGATQASSVASVYLSVAPEMRVSEDVAAGSAGDPGVVPYLACSCGQSGSPAVLWAAGLALVLLRRRRRAAC